MAIFADYTKTTYTEHETETVIQEVTYPNDLPEGHTKYEFRGQTVNETFPLIIENSTTLSDAYIVITSYMFYKKVVIDSQNLFDIQFDIYNSKQDYLDGNDPTYVDGLVGQYHTIVTSDDLRIKGYEILKEQVYLDNIIDD
jgi:hypothetical protein